MNELAQRQHERLVAIDPELPEQPSLPEGEWLHSKVPDGHEVGGMFRRTFHGADDEASLWAARHHFELIPALGNTGAAGMEAVLGEFRSRMRDETPDQDSACVVHWPSRDVQPTPVLLEHGFVPMRNLAVRTKLGQAERSTWPAEENLHIRRATPADEDQLLLLEATELRYSSMAGTNVIRDNAAQLLATGLHRSVFFDGRVWLAESEGVPVGLARCGLAAPAAGSSIEGRVREGRWGYVGTLSVAESARGTGVGQALMSVAHHELAKDRVRGTCLFYHPSNPLSSVFWHRQGYRPLWTSWQVRPASALR